MIGPRPLGCITNSIVCATAIRRQRLMERLYECGPRPIFELLVELDSFHPGLLADYQTAAEKFIRVPASVYRALGADRFPSPPVYEVGSQCQL